MRDDAGDDATARGVLQVEKHDYTDLRPAARTRAHGMDGFDPIYTDIVDYIIRCTHRIWDERDIGLIYTHYAHNAVVYTTLGATYSREDVVRATIQRIAEYPERRGYGTQVIWGGNDADGFYTSHLVTSVGRFTAPGRYGPPNGRSFVMRTIADCMVYRNRIYREWLVYDTMSQLQHLGIDPEMVATKMAENLIARGANAPQLGDTARMLGQEPPHERVEATLAANDRETALLQSLHEMWNGRMFGRARNLYSAHAVWHGPRMRDVSGHGAITHQLISLLGLMPDATWTPQHICSVEPANEGGAKFAIRWTLDGHHSGFGTLGAPTGKMLHLLAMSHYHMSGGRIVEEYTLWDEVALLAQTKLPAA
ncbi:MAG: ester cyclase [Acidisphaera sp.]|nr:ester cyclase [Acidisphaera sp.]